MSPYNKHIVAYEGSSMNKSVVVVGLGEMGSVFARGFLRSGNTVVPVIRGMEMHTIAAEITDPALVLIAVGEADLHGQLAKVPEAWKDRLVLLQNELLPRDWQQYGFDPTVISVWFEKKKGQDSKFIIPSPVYGKHAQQLADALASIDITTKILEDEAALLHELVLKNVYILTSNISGLQVGGNVGQLWDDHKTFAQSVATDVIRLQEALTGKILNHQALIDDMVAAFDGDREHMCMGRSAAMRLQRALILAKENNLSLPMLERISQL
jgi:ketopantoate reductase